jgi:hypothetical protein
MLIADKARGRRAPADSQVRGPELHAARTGISAKRTAIKCSLLILTIATAGVVSFASSASAAGNGYGFGGGGPPFPGGFVSVLCAKEITHSGGTLTARVGHGTLVVDVGPGPRSGTTQYIVVLANRDLPSSSSQSAHGSAILGFSVLAEVRGKPVPAAASVTVSYVGSDITSGTQVAVYTSGRLTTQPSSVAGHTLTFRTAPNRAIAVFGR